MLPGRGSRQRRRAFILFSAGFTHSRSRFNDFWFLRLIRAQSQEKAVKHTKECSLCSFLSHYFEENFSHENIDFQLVMHAQRVKVNFNGALFYFPSRFLLCQTLILCWINFTRLLRDFSFPPTTSVTLRYSIWPAYCSVKVAKLIRLEARWGEID